MNIQLNKNLLDWIDANRSDKSRQAFIQNQLYKLMFENTDLQLSRGTNEKQQHK